MEAKLDPLRELHFRNILLSYINSSDSEGMFQLSFYIKLFIVRLSNFEAKKINIETFFAKQTIWFYIDLLSFSLR